MEALMDRYLDGELTAEEAREFLTALRQNPDLDVELRMYEQILANVARQDIVVASPGFTDRVMADVRATATAKPALHQRKPMPRWRSAWALAASLALVFGLGYLAARLGPDAFRQRVTDGEAPFADAGGQLAALAPETISPGEPDVRVVRLVYVPRSETVREVAVAGTFNAWDPTRTPMQQQGELWTALLVLPADTYEYMFVEDGETWHTDPLALQTRDDGFGRVNAVLDLTL
jgi:hypothetical protein